MVREQKIFPHCISCGVEFMQEFPPAFCPGCGTRQPGGAQSALVLEEISEIQQFLSSALGIACNFIFYRAGHPVADILIRCRFGNSAETCLLRCSAPKSLSFVQMCWTDLQLELREDGLISVFARKDAMVVCERVYLLRNYL
jgi:hypothetical protein